MEILVGAVPKLYAYFNNTEGLSILVMELLGDNLESFVGKFQDKIYPRLVTNFAVQMVSFRIEYL